MRCTQEKPIPPTGSPGPSIPPHPFNPRGGNAATWHPTSRSRSRPRSSASPHSPPTSWASPTSTSSPTATTRPRSRCDYLDSLPSRPDGKLILVTAISPTPAGEGKTTTTVGLGDALNRIGKKAMICLREPSLGPVFGMKGGAAGGGYAQVVPMEDINLHFTGDFNAIALANNLLAAMLDNHIHHGNELGIDVRRITLEARGGHERPRAARHRRRPGRPGQRLPAPGRLRHRRRLRGDGDLLPGHVAART